MLIIQGRTGKYIDGKKISAWKVGILFNLKVEFLRKRCRQGMKTKDDLMTKYLLGLHYEEEIFSKASFKQHGFLVSIIFHLKKSPLNFSAIAAAFNFFSLKIKTCITVSFFDAGHK